MSNEIKTGATQLALVSLIFALTTVVLLLSTLVAFTMVEHWEMKRDCEERLARNAHCIAGYFPMEVIETYTGSGVEVPRDER